MSRNNIYYWKCDRPAAFHGTGEQGRSFDDVQPQLQEALKEYFQADSLVLTTAAGQGNHLTWNAEMDGLLLFIRVEDGPEKDDYIEMESALLRKVASIGVPAPQVYGCDASRTRVPFAWQALERIPYPDLNYWYKRRSLNTKKVAFEIGRNVATWQNVGSTGFGPLNLATFQATEAFQGVHPRYSDYFLLRFEEHLAFLVAREFISETQRDDIAAAINTHARLLTLDSGCLVHKDLALWNILGSASHIAAFIDFDDAILGDPMDDLSLLACFHDAEFLSQAIEGYSSLRVLPENHLTRFWLHLLRNLIVKAVIRVGSGYFERDDQFFLISPGGTGTTLKQQTEDRIAVALRGLRSNADLSTLTPDFSLL